jgi:nicotinate phosphoribosyltransferase
MCATAARRFRAAAGSASLIDFSLRRSPGPIAARRIAYGAQLAGFTGTSNVAAARDLSFRASGTMAHSFVQASETELDAFMRFGGRYGRDAVFLVDTDDSIQGIHNAARAADRLRQADPPVEVRGVRLDSGDLLDLSRYARRHFDEKGLPFMKIYASGSLDELRIARLVADGAPIDGFGVGARFAAATDAQYLDIVYKPVRIGEKDVSKSSPGKETLPGRKMVRRTRSASALLGDTVRPIGNAGDQASDLLAPLDPDRPGAVAEARDRMSADLAMLDAGIQRLINPEVYPVTIAL